MEEKDKRHENIENSPERAEIHRNPPWSLLDPRHHMRYVKAM